MRDNSSSPHPTENPAAPLIQPDPSILAPNRRAFGSEDPAWPSLPPSTTDFQDADKSPPRSKPLIGGFERPSFSRIVILTVLCLITYPAFYTLKLVARDQSLFVVRLIVSIWCSGVGFALGYILLKIGAQHLEAATWATVIHMSYEGGGMKLRDLARSSSNPTSFLPAFHIFRSRFWDRGTAARSRKSYDKRPWSLFVVFFVLLAVLGPLIPFLFGRIMRIETFVRNQNKVYREVLIAGDLSQDDLTRAETQVVLQPQGVSRIWPASPSGGSASGTTEFAYGNDTVYFAQPSPSRFVPGGSGTGAFHTNQTAPISPNDTPNNTLGSGGWSAPESNTGVVLRYPQWGIRVHCEKLPNPEINLIPLSNQSFTYVFIPRDFLRGLFGTYGMDLPKGFASSPFFMIDANDSVPPNIDPSTIAWIGKFPNDGSGVSLRPLYPEETWDQEWTTVETVLLRLDTDSTPSGHFPVHWKNTFSTPSTQTIRTGYDAAVCVQKYEPWIIETYNTSIVSPSALRVVGKGNDGTSLLPSGIIRGAPMANTRNLNATGKNPVFIHAHENSIGGIMVTNNDWIAGYYRPTPIAVSFTNGTGPQGYTELRPDRLAVIRGRAGAANTLPYLVGSGSVVAQSYGDETLAFATYKQWQLIGLPILIWVLGMIGELFVPALPLNIPRREFGVYSWLALFQSQELRFEAADDLDKFMNLDKLEERYSEKRVKFAV